MSIQLSALHHYDMLLQRDVDGEGGIVELTHRNDIDVLTTVFSLVAVHPEDAHNVIKEATSFAREQVALYGEAGGCRTGLAGCGECDRTSDNWQSAAATHDQRGAFRAAGTREIFVRGKEVERARAAVEEAAGERGRMVAQMEALAAQVADLTRKLEVSGAATRQCEMHAQWLC